MKMEDEAYRRIIELLNTAANDGRDVIERGSWTHADFDELLELSKIANPLFSDHFHEILEDSSTFDDTQYFQGNLAERLLRSIKVSGKYGLSRNSEVTEIEPYSPTFDLDKSDKKRVLKLCTDIRKIVLSSSFFDEPHKVRLLNRIAAIEKQVHKKKGLLDTVLGGVVDVGQALGAFGKEVKPLTDRMQEIASITQRNTKEYEQLPAPDEVKSLPAPEENEE